MTPLRTPLKIEAYDALQLSDRLVENNSRSSASHLNIFELGIFPDLQNKPAPRQMRMMRHLYTDNLTHDFNPVLPAGELTIGGHSVGLYRLAFNCLLHSNVPTVRIVDCMCSDDACLVVIVIA